MSENSQNKELRESSVAAEDGAVEPTDGGGEGVPVSAEIVNQVDAPHSVQDSNNVKVAEDGGKEDMFVDCSDEIEESHQNEEGNDIVWETQPKELNNETEAQKLMAEVQNLRDKLEKTVAEKHNVEQVYEEERTALKRELNYLHHQLKELNVQHLSLDKNHDGLVDHHDGPELSDKNENHQESVATLHEMINDCSKLLENSLDLNSPAKCSTKDFQTALQMKDLEIEELKSKIAECSVSQDVLLSYLSSKHETFSQPSEVQLERDKNIEEIAKRILASLPMTFHKEGLAEESIVEKFSHVEESTRILIAKHNEFLSEIQLLKCCLTEISADITINDEVEILSATCGKLLELKRREVDLDQKLKHFENENMELAEQLNRNKEIIENANAEMAKLNAELEQEKMRYANTKEKLTLAVTKGKALVQQRDSLKQVLADKTSELEKCLTERQEKSTALEAAKQTEDLLVKSENFTASLQESLMQRDSIIQKCGELLSDAAGCENIQFVDIIEKIRWLTDDRNQHQSLALEFHKLSDALSSISFPEDVPSNELDTQVKWLVQSFYLAKEEALKLQEDIAGVKDAASKAIDHMTTSLLAETQEKEYLREELQDLRSKYEAIVEKEYQVSMEKDQFVSALLNASGIKIDSLEEEVNFPKPGISGIIEKCIKRIKEEAGNSLETSQDKVEFFERLQSLLYLRDQELMLYVNLMEEEVQDIAVMNQLSNELKVVNEALHTLTTEKDSLQKDLERSEEKAALLREKLSMAVKKGKGLVQERENLKGMLEGKSVEIESLKSELQEQAVTCNGLKDQINKLLGDVDRIPKLETDLISTEERRNELEQFLLESNNMLQKLIECIDSIDHPADMVFQEPVEKVNWLATYLNDCQTAKAQTHRELVTVKHDASTLIGKMQETEMSMNLMEKSLADSERKISQLLEEKRELEFARIQSLEELQKAAEEVTLLKSKFTEVSTTMRSQEDALMLAEENISKLIIEKQDALACKAAADMELQKLKEENSINVSKLAGADKTIQSLEDALSHVQTSFSQLSEEHNKTVIVRSDKEDELNKVKGEADSLATKLSDAFITIKSLEDALANAENNVSDLVKANKNSEQEILELNSRLTASLHELAGTRGTLQYRSHELSIQFASLQLLLSDDTLLSLVQQSLAKKTESLKDMDLIFREIREKFSKIDSEVLQNCPVAQDDSSFSALLPVEFDDVLNSVIVNDDLNAAVDENFIHFQETVEKFHSRDKNLANRIERFSKFVDELILALLEKLRATKDGVMVTFELLKSLEQKVDELEMNRHTDENMIPILENDIKTLFSACTNAIHELESQSEDDLLDFSSIPTLGYMGENFSRELGTFVGCVLVDHELNLDGSKYEQTAKELLFTARHSRHLREQFQDIKKLVVHTIEGLQNELEETKMTCRKFSEERDLNQHQICKLETELRTLQNLYNEMRLEVEDYPAKEAMWKEREAELSAAHATSVMKVHEFQDFPLSKSQIRALFDKINAIDLSLSESEVNDLETHDSADVWKLFYIVDKFGGLLRQINLEAQENRSLQSKLEKQVLEIEHLKEEVAEHVSEKQGAERMKNELAVGLEDIIQKLGGDELVGVHKAVHVMGLLPILEKMVMATRQESEHLKSKIEELNTKLLGTQKAVDDLSSKLNLMEESNPVMVNLPESVQEKGIFESSSALPSNSEISEIQDLGPIGKQTAVSSVPSAAHARTLRKGSNDHLAIVVDPESQKLINNEPSDDDKGHVFKSLNTSGLIPRQGKMVADRVDGIWVSGGRALMRHPRARLGLIAYSLFLHIWLLGSIL